MSVEETQGDPRILLSRARKEFVAALMKLEVPEIEDGISLIRAHRAGAGTSLESCGGVA